MKEKTPRFTFEELDVYKVARQFRKEMYRLVRALPDCERFALAGQMRRAAISLTNNIAEGHGRYHYLDQIKFMLHSRGSLEELIDDLNICEDENYCPSSELEVLKEQGWRLRQLIDGYIRYLRAQKESVREESPAYGNGVTAEDDLLIAIAEDRYHESRITNLESRISNLESRISNLESTDAHRNL